MKRVRISDKKSDAAEQWLHENDIRHHQTAEFERGWEVELNNKDAKLLEKLLKDQREHPCLSWQQGGRE